MNQSVKNNIFVLLVLLLGFKCAAQNGEIVVSGKIKEVATGKPLKAKINYLSVPTGSIKGSFNDSTFIFSVFGSSKYQVTAVLDNYIPKTILVDPKSFAGKDSIYRDIILTPRGQTIRLEHLLFEQKKSEIDPQSFEELDEIVAMLEENPKMVIQLEGHTDSNGNAKANMDLSQERVDAVKKYLSGKGIEKSRVKTKAFGGTKPVTKQKTAEARNLNRRVEMRVLSEN
jgi:OmpA-OmpF porin, OOP family